MINKVALYIPRPGVTSQVIQNGYVDTLRHLGWKVYCGNPKTKLCCREWIEKHDIGLILTHSRYGIRQLPIQTINDENVAVIVNVLPLDFTRLTVDGHYEFAHNDESDILEQIQRHVLHTRLEPSLHPEYMLGWSDVEHVPAAGTYLKLCPRCVPL